MAGLTGMSDAVMDRRRIVGRVTTRITISSQARQDCRQLGMEQRLVEDALRRPDACTSFHHGLLQARRIINGTRVLIVQFEERWNQRQRIRRAITVGCEGDG
jgi:hypothetical protein